MFVIGKKGKAGQHTLTEQSIVVTVQNFRTL